MKLQRIQQKRTKGWRKPPNTVCVSRPSKWGNPFRVEQHGREKALALYRDWLMRGDGQRLRLEELRGRNLACFCRLDQPCHADILLEIANHYGKLERLGAESSFNRHDRRTSRRQGCRGDETPQVRPKIL